MGSLFEQADREAMLGRIARLRPDRKPEWGRFTAPEMVCHVSCGLRQGLGELESGPPSGALSRAPFNWLVIHVIPWPKGKAKSPPEFLTTRPTTWEADAFSYPQKRRLVFPAHGPYDALVHGAAAVAVGEDDDRVPRTRVTEYERLHSAAVAPVPELVALTATL